LVKSQLARSSFLEIPGVTLIKDQYRRGCWRTFLVDAVSF
jgi:hypothetical protein